MHPNQINWKKNVLLRAWFLPAFLARQHGQDDQLHYGATLKMGGKLAY